MKLGVCSIMLCKIYLIEHIEKVTPLNNAGKMVVQILEKIYMIEKVS